MLQPNSGAVDLAALSAEDALGLLKLLFITTLHLTGSRSEDLARLRANFNIFSTVTQTFGNTWLWVRFHSYLRTTAITSLATNNLR